MRVLPVLLACVLLSVASLCRADSWGPAPARIFASEDGERILKVVPNRGADLLFTGTSTGTWMRLNADGSEAPSNQIALANTPVRVLIPDSRINGFVSLDTHASLGYKHALVIYKGTSEVVRDLTLEDFLSADEIQQHVQRSVSSRWWRTDAVFTFEVPTTRTPVENGEIVLEQPEEAALVIAFAWGKKVRIKLATGEVLPQVLAER